MYDGLKVPHGWKGDSQQADTLLFRLLYGVGVVDEPIAVCGVIEQWKQALAHAGVISIKVGDFVGGHEFANDGGRVDGTESEGFEA